jgi:cytochrome c oxidase assembly protein subunit 11
MVSQYNIRTFVPETRTINLVPGETSLSFFKASNPTKEDIVGISTYRLNHLIIA